MSSQNRAICYDCYRPKSSCMCAYIHAFDTNTRFVLLMHPKEFRKTKNGTGHFTNLSLNHCEIHVGVDFSKHEVINAMIEDQNHACYVLYPGEKSINLNETPIGSKKKNTVLFLIDSTWPCSRAILRASKNLDQLEKVSFTHSKSSNFMFKEQPQDYCLSTMESTLCVLELLNAHQAEQIAQKDLDHFLKPFEKMVAYQLSCNL